MDEPTPRPRRIEVPEPVRAVADLAEPSYTDALEIGVVEVDRRSAEQWARAVFEGAPRWLARFVYLGWRFGLFLRLTKAPERILGWAVIASTDQWIVMEATSPFLTAHLVTAVGNRSVVQATFVRFDRRAAAFMWPLTVPLHRLITKYLVRHAVAQAPTR